MFTRSKAKLASTLEPAEVLESLQTSDEGSGNAISHGGPKSTQNSVSLSQSHVLDATRSSCFRVSRF